MQKILSIIFAITLLLGCKNSEKNKEDEIKRLPRIAIAGLAIESSTFSPALTHEDAFHTKVKDAVFSFYPFMSPDSINRQRAHWIPTIRGHALPGGTVTREAYESLVTKTLEMLKENGPDDGLFF